MHCISGNKKAGICARSNPCFSLHFQPYILQLSAFPSGSLLSHIKSAECHQQTGDKEPSETSVSCVSVSRVSLSCSFLSQRGRFCLTHSALRYIVFPESFPVFLILQCNFSQMYFVARSKGKPERVEIRFMFIRFHR